MKTVCVFSGAHGSPRLFQEGYAVGQELAQAGWQVMYGGSSRGVMGGLARGVQSADGAITGVLPEKIAQLKHYDPDISLVVTKNMDDRKAYMFEHSDAFLCLPGSYGSMDELFSVLTLIKLGYLPRKPVVVLNSDGFYDGLETLLTQMKEQGTISHERSSLVQFVKNPNEAVKALGHENA